MGISYNHHMSPAFAIVAVSIILIAVLLLVRVGRGSAGSRETSHPAKPDSTSPMQQPAAVPGANKFAENLTLEQKLEHLALCGLKLAEPFTVEDLLYSWEREQLEQPGYDFLFSALAMCEEREPWRQLCDSVYNFDTECIENDDDYTNILMQIAAMTKGDMLLSAFSEQVPIGGGKAHLSFKCNDLPVAIEFEQDNDWFSEQVLDRVLSLQQTTGSKRRFFLRDTGDQTVEIGCLFPEQIEQLRQLGLVLDVLE